MGIAALPRENLDGGRGSLRRRLRRMLERSETVSWWEIVLMANHGPVRFKVAKRKGDGTYQNMDRAYENDCAPVKSPMMVFSAAEDLITHACQL
jgi:hypothetical protein